MDSEDLTLKQEILNVYIGAVDTKDALTQLVSLHVRLHVHQLNLTKVASILRPICRVHHELETLSLVTKTITAPQVFPHHGKSVLQMPENRVTFIVEMLFSFFCSCSAVDHKDTATRRASDDDKFRQWCKSYCNIVS